MIRRLAITAGAIFVAFSFAACSSSEGGTPPANTGSSPGATNPAAGNGAVPDACGLITAEQLGQLLGKPAGTGSPASVSPERSICVYDGGIITAVEVADHYDGSRDSIEQNGSTTTDVPGVGQGAFYDSNGQLIATGTRVFVAVTASGIPIAKMVEVVKVMLTNAGESV